ncbi:MAG: proline--tRNA ligase [Lachnospiraceae bacterium]|nr:proline--tRNA ligase [Lachnospiraceae bacterium]
MAKKLVQNITAREEDFAQWYTDVVREAKLCDYSGVKGCMNYLPNGYALWENIQKNLDARFKETGVENVYLPVMIPESLLQKEKDHIEGFAPEVAWVTHGGLEELQERFCIRPTSETLFCDVWSKTVQSYRDLPKVWNQWCSVLRWEKTTRPFLRSREFLWQEGHTIHATYEEAEERTKQMWRVYRDFAQDVLAIPVVSGRKTESEKFAGAQDTYTIEALMHDGKALQSATSHFFGSSFPSAFGIQYSDKNNELHEVYETSWGLSTRIIGALIMVHGDNSGLVLPPKVAPTQVVIIPIQQRKEGVLDKAYELKDRLSNFRVKVDDTDKSPGWKFAEAEMRGIPVRVEIGPKDIEAGKCVLARRDTGEKLECALDELEAKIAELMETIQKDMLEKARKHRESHTYVAKNMEEMGNILNNTPGFVKAMWCGCQECEDKIKEQFAATSRCMPFEQETLSDTCVCCGKPAKKMVYWGKAY